MAAVASRRSNGRTGNNQIASGGIRSVLDSSERSAEGRPRRLRRRIRNDPSRRFRAKRISIPALSRMTSAASRSRPRAKSRARKPLDVRTPISRATSCNHWLHDVEFDVWLFRFVWTVGTMIADFGAVASGAVVGWHLCSCLRKTTISHAIAYIITHAALAVVTIGLISSASVAILFLFGLGLGAIANAGFLTLVQAKRHSNATS
jgi:hypothetical protein